MNNEHIEPKHDLRRSEYDTAHKMSTGEGDMDAHDCFIRQMGGEVKAITGHSEAVSHRKKMTKCETPPEPQRSYEPAGIDAAVRPIPPTLGCYGM